MTLLITWDGKSPLPTWAQYAWDNCTECTEQQDDMDRGTGVFNLEYNTDVMSIEVVVDENDVVHSATMQLELDGCSLKAW